MTKREYFKATVKDLVGSLVYYDRKEDDELSEADVDALFRNEEITLNEVMEIFRVELENYIDYVKRN